MRKAVWVLSVALLASCASDPNEGQIAHAPENPWGIGTGTCQPTEQFVAERPSEGWFAEGKASEHPLGNEVERDPIDVGDRAQLQLVREVRFKALQHGLTFGLASTTRQHAIGLCLEDRDRWATYNETAKDFKDDLGNTLTLRWISPLVGSFPWFTTPTGDIEIRRDGGVDILLNDYSPSRQEVWVVDDDGTAFMIRMTGADSPNLAGWPTTFAPPLDAPEPQPSPLGVDALLEIASEVLVLDI